MVKTPGTRHSRAHRDPKTIDLDSGEVSRSAPEDRTEILDLQPSADADPAGAASPEAPLAEVEEPAAKEAGPEDADDLGGSSDTQPAGSDPAPTAEDTPPAARVEWRQARTDPDSDDGLARQKAAGGRTRALAAGILGGLVALAGGGLLQFTGLLGVPGGGAAPGSNEMEIASLKAEIAELRERTGDSAAATEMSGVVDGLARTVDRLGADVASLQESAGAAGGGDSGALSALNQRIGEVETAITGLSAQPGSAPEALAPLNERIAGLEAMVKAAGEADTAADGRLSAVEQSVSALRSRVDAQAAQPEIALAIAAAALKSAIERGVPFEAEIETFAAVAPDAPEIATLRSYAETGVPTRADILAEAETAADAMIAAANPPPADAGFFERLLASAESLVTVRPVGAVKGAGVPETVARMEVAVRAGDLEQAIAEFDTLPETAKAAGAGLADRIRARIEVERLADQAIASAMKA